MRSFDSYFTDQQIISLLARQRSRVAKDRHDLHFQRNISFTARKPSTHKHFICDLFPPRRKWLRLVPKERFNKNALVLNQRTLERTVKKLHKESKGSEKPSWLIQLDGLVADIRACAIGTDSYSVPKPMIHAHLKEKNVFRPIASYELRDKIIIGQVARYLIDVFDRSFLNCSYAFRSGRLSHSTPTHHKAVKDILEYRRQRAEGSIWVAECDIKKFYDCVSHETARHSLVAAVDRAKGNGVIVDPRALTIFDQYLETYSFNGDVEPLNRNIEWWRQNGVEGGSFPWISEKEKEDLYGGQPTEAIGVPQGGAISCLIANLVLDQVDRKILDKFRLDPNLFYARYCDDMIVLHSDRVECKEVLSIYETTLKDLKLITHPPQEITFYKKDFWSKTKNSKLPYNWNNPHFGKMNVPWIAFVGYQIRYDGTIRVRPSSIKKELKKQTAECDNVLRSLRIKSQHKIKFANTARSRGEILFRFRQRLIAMSVGRVRPQKDFVAPFQFCWTAGFRLLKGAKFVGSQIKLLDRNREKQILRLKKHLAKNKNTIQKKPSGRKNRMRYYGAPYSYFRQFLH